MEKNCNIRIKKENNMREILRQTKEKKRQNERKKMAVIIKW